MNGALAPIVSPAPPALAVEPTRWRGRTAQVEPTPAAHMRLHVAALEIGIGTNHSTCDTMYLAFAIAMGATAVVTADGAFVRSRQSHPDVTLSATVRSLETWAKSQGVSKR
jgi:hypothetical protein